MYVYNKAGSYLCILVFVNTEYSIISIDYIKRVFIICVHAYVIYMKYREFEF